MTGEKNYYIFPKGKLNDFRRYNINNEFEDAMKVEMYNKSILLENAKKLIKKISE